MRIYHETTHVSPANTAEWLCLSVINRFDLDTKAICFKDGIGFCLKKNVAINSLQYKSNVIAPDEAMKTEIERMGYHCV